MIHFLLLENPLCLMMTPHLLLDLTILSHHGISTATFSLLCNVILDTIQHVLPNSSMNFPEVDLNFQNGNLLNIIAKCCNVYVLVIECDRFN